MVINLGKRIGMGYVKHPYTMEITRDGNDCKKGDFLKFKWIRGIESPFSE